MRAHPRHVFLDLTTECNLKCVQCDIHLLRDPEGAMSDTDRYRVIDQLAEWSSEIRVVLTGGEQFLARKRLYTLAAHCAHRGVYLTVSSNGTILKPDDLERLPTSGIRCIVFSVDDDRPDMHDRIRGVPGTYERVMRSIRTLAGLPGRDPGVFSVLTSTILGAHNLGRIPQLLDALEATGIDCMLFQPLQPRFAGTYDKDWWRRDPLYQQDAALVDRGVDALVAAKRQGRRLFQTEEQLEDMRSYFKAQGRASNGQCVSMEESMMVDILGQVRLCFSMERIGLGPIGRVQDSDLRTLWASVSETRSRMRGCTEGCGAMICHAR